MNAAIESGQRRSQLQRSKRQNKQRISGRSGRLTGLGVTCLGALALLLVTSCKSGPDGTDDPTADGAVASDAAFDATAPDSGIEKLDIPPFDYTVGELDFPDVHDNAPPVVTWLAPEEGLVALLGETVTFKLSVLDDTTLPADLSLSVTLGLLPLPTTPDLVVDDEHAVSFDLTLLPAGSHTITVTARDAMGASTETSRTFVINSPPGAPEVQISPADPTTDDELVAQISKHAVDVDRALPTDKAYSWTWRVDGVVAVGLEGTKVPAAKTSPGQVWQAIVYANDGYEDGPQAIAWAVVKNRPPMAPELTLEPAAPTVASQVKCVIKTPAKDLDGQEISYTYAWTLGGVDLPEAGTADTVTLAQAATPVWQALIEAQAGDVLGCVAHASDGIALSTAATVSVALEPFDGCAANPGACHADATCKPSQTLAVSCACKDGFVGDGLACADVDECADGSAKCAANQTCGNIAGTYECLCKPGWKADGATCVDADECLDGTAKCDPNADCDNDEGGYSCSCKSGYEGDGMTCGDVNECKGGGPACGVGAQCANTEGSFTCTCVAGFLTKDDGCEDIDECETGAAKCDSAADCANSIGGYDCVCKAGFVGNGKQCQDVNECLSGAAKCHSEAKCTNTEGAYACACDSGWHGDGKTCADIDECKTGAAKCDANADCKNNPGSYGCQCKAGFKGDGKTCADIDECQTGAFACDNAADCKNMDGGYICQCKAGYIGDGKICEDVDECAAGKAQCHAAATCANVPGSYECTCKPGWTGDGKTCQPAQAG